jgi:hypothetical protein
MEDIKAFANSHMAMMTFSLFTSIDLVGSGENM